jgi:membrane protease YdiL (CAAX protease family)
LSEGLEMVHSQATMRSTDVIKTMEAGDSRALTVENGVCASCGAPLDRRAYFCIVCAASYKNVELVLTRSEPAPLNDGDRIKRKVPQAWELFWTYAIVVFVVGITSFLLFDSGEVVLPSLIATVAMFGTTLFFSIRYWPTLRNTLSTTGLLHWQSYAGLLGLGGLLLINMVYHGWLIGLDGVSEDPGLIQQLHESDLGYWGVVILIAIMPGVTEEVAFRGLLQTWLSAAVRPWRAVIFAAALFAALHCSIVSAPYLFAVGMLLGWVRKETGSLYPSIVLHALHNYIVIYYIIGYTG